MTDLPTARTTLQAGVGVFVWCKACQHRGFADLQAIIDGGRGDVPIRDLRYRCTCGSRRTDWVVMARSAAGVQPWRQAGLNGNG